jgi:DNA-binding MarR family transcriptional regulator
MAGVVAAELKQKAAFASNEQEVFLGLRLAAARMTEPLEKFLKTTANLTHNQYNVLRILRGSHPAPLPSGEIAERMVTRDPDITRLVDRLARRGLVRRVRSRRDRRVVEVGITPKGQEILATLDDYVGRFPGAVLGHLGPRKLAELRQLIELVISGIRAI